MEKQWQDSGSLKCANAITSHVLCRLCLVCGQGCRHNLQATKQPRAGYCLYEYWRRRPPRLNTWGWIGSWSCPDAPSNENHVPGSLLFARSGEQLAFATS
jgi:hypothetical protein